MLEWGGDWQPKRRAPSGLSSLRDFGWLWVWNIAVLYYTSIIQECKSTLCRDEGERKRESEENAL